MAIDARPAVSAGRTGVGHYARELIVRLPEADPGSTYIAWYLNARRALRPWRWSRRFFPPRANLVERWNPIPATWFERTSNRYDLPPVERLVRFDVLFAPNFVPPPTRTGRLVITIHDMAFRRFPETAPLATRRWLVRLDRAIRQAAEIVVPSEATRRDVSELTEADGDRITVIPHGIDHDVFRPASPEAVERVRRRHGIDGPYLLFVGGLEPRKNLPALLRAYASMPPDLRPGLVLAGASVPWNPEGRTELSAELSRLRADVRAGVILTGYVSDPDRAPLYTGAEAMVFPSLYEGFGFPVLEAMACGTPVVTSNVSSLPEVAGDDAVLVDPTDPDAIADGLRRVLEDGTLAERLRRAGPGHAARFRWEGSARSHAEVLRRAGER
ncbi:MAG TPA: glycosyltransferase family 1 protein [Actinomycetota bacterium]|nr:glycosyltransferase family 1 protein [Actinomycetota bacterium]